MANLLAFLLTWSLFWQPEVVAYVWGTDLLENLVVRGLIVPIPNYTLVRYRYCKIVKYISSDIMVDLWLKIMQMQIEARSRVVCGLPRGKFARLLVGLTN